MPADWYYFAGTAAIAVVISFIVTLLCRPPNPGWDEVKEAYESGSRWSHYANALVAHPLHPLVRLAALLGEKDRDIARSIPKTPKPADKQREHFQRLLKQDADSRIQATFRPENV